MTYRFIVLFMNGTWITRDNQDLEDWPIFVSKTNNYAYRKRTPIVIRDAIVPSLMVED